MTNDEQLLQPYRKAIMRYKAHSGFGLRSILQMAIIAAVGSAAWPADAGAAEHDAVLCCRKWVALAEKYAEGIENGAERSEAFYKLTYAHLHAGELDAARFSATRVTEPLKAVYALTSVAKRYRENSEQAAVSELLAKAQQVAHSSEKARTSNFLYGDLIRAYVESGMTDEALAFAETLPAWHRDSGMRDVAQALAMQGNVERALEIVRTRIFGHSNESAMVDVARTCAREALVDETRLVLQQIAEAAHRDSIFERLAEALAKGGRLEKAEEAAAEITDPQERSKARATILRKWAEGQDAAAIATRLREVATREEREALYHRLIEKLPADGRIAEAERAIEELVAVIRNSPRPPETTKFGRGDDTVAIAFAKSHYLLTAKALAKQGDRQAARERIQRAAETIVTLDRATGIGKIFGLTGLIDAQIEIGDLDSARTNLIQTGDVFPPAAARVGVAYARAGDTRSAIEVAALIRANHAGRGMAFGKVAAAVHLAGEPVEAQQLLTQLDDATEQADAFRSAGRYMLEHDGGAKLIKWLDAMPTELARTHASIGAAEALCRKAAR